MKKLISLVVMLLLVGSLYAGNTYEQAVKSQEYGGYVVFSGTVDMTADSIGNFYTNWIDIGNLKGDYGILLVRCSSPNTAVEDVNVYAQFSPTTTTADAMAAFAITGLDQVVNTTLGDTIGVQVGVKKVDWNYRYVSFYFDGQTGNGKCVVSWWFYAKKTEPFYGNQGKDSWINIQKRAN